MNITDKLKNKRIYFDGGYGTLLQERGLMPGELPEMWNITHADVICDIHREYLDAGSDIITSNTFGANRLKYDGKCGRATLPDIINAAMDNAKKAVSTYSGNEEKYIALDVGPLGRLLKPLGDMEFEKAYDIFAETVKLGAEAGAQLIIIETMNDMYETKAALLAAKENSSLPVFVTNAYDESGKLMTGASPSAMVSLLEGLHADAIGINCSFGPDKMHDVVSELLKYASCPVIVNPNAGLPVFKNGKTEYELSPEKFADLMCLFAEQGVNILGGCCGTTPTHIRILKEKAKDIPFVYPAKKDFTLVSSYTHSVEFSGKPVLIGERINPTGKAKFKAALREKDYDYVLNEGISQQDCGADILDVNVGLPEIDEKAVLVHIIQQLQAVSSLPLQIDTSDFDAMEAAMRIYNGKPLINSVNGKDESMEAIFPIAAKYGGVLIALTLDESGIPETVAERIAIAEKIIKKAAEYGIDKKDIIVDPLCLTISSDKMSAKITLGCIEKLKEMGIKSSLGVSNVSFGLPERHIINTAFFTMAMHSGLNAAIMNPKSREMMEAYFGYCALFDYDTNFENYISYTQNTIQDDTAQTAAADISHSDMLKRAILKGLKDEAESSCKMLLSEMNSIDIIGECIIPPLDEIGVKFEQKTAFLPQLLMSAEAAKSAFDVIKTSFTASGEKREKKCKFVIATVKGDIHDIGKNIVKVMLENYDYDVIDLGKDVPAEDIVNTVISENASIVGLSALMTTTVPAMEETIKLLREKCPQTCVVVGGAVLTQEYADMIGADKYARDAMETVRYADCLSKTE